MQDMWRTLYERLGDEAKDTQNLLVHEIIAHNWTMPELAGVFRAKGTEAKKLLDTAIKQAPTHSAPNC